MNMNKSLINIRILGVNIICNANEKYLQKINKHCELRIIFMHPNI